MTVYALTVGINAYLPPVPALYGCVDDVAAFSTVLATRLGDSLQQVTLLNEQATRAAVIDGWQRHLGQAGAGDVALFFYGGHGGEEPAPPELVNLEATKRLQNLICYDSGRRVNGKLVRALADKELAALIRGVAANGAHVAVLLDCCHSGSGTRDAAVTVRQWVADPAVLTGADRSSRSSWSIRAPPVTSSLAHSTRRARPRITWCCRRVRTSRWPRRSASTAGCAARSALP